MRVAASACALACAVALPTACAPKPPPRVAPESLDDWLLGYAGAFRRAEPVMLGMLARADARLAGRLAPRSARGHFTDPFLFDMRRREVLGVQGEAQRCALPRDLLRDVEVLADHRVEQELLFRLIDEEEARLDEERRLPSSAADLVRALAVSWPPLLTPSEQRATESLVAWRLDQVRGALAPNALSALERDDLADALDDLARAVERAPAPHATTALAQLGSDVAHLAVAPLALGEWEDVARLLRVHLGVVSGEDRLRAAFAAARGKLSAQLDVGLAVIGPAASEEVRAIAGAKLARAPECPAVPQTSSVRALAPPRERTWACAAVQSAREGESALSELVSLVVLHDIVAIGAWAVDLHSAPRDPASARARSPLASRATPASVALAVREAATHPAGPIGGAVAVVMLLGEGPAKLRARAGAWAEFGDAPLDVVGRELFGQARASEGARGVSGD